MIKNILVKQYNADSGKDLNNVRTAKSANYETMMLIKDKLIEDSIASRKNSSSSNHSKNSNNANNARSSNSSNNARSSSSSSSPTQRDCNTTQNDSNTTQSSSSVTETQVAYPRRILNRKEIEEFHPYWLPDLPRTLHPAYQALKPKTTDGRSNYSPGSASSAHLSEQDTGVRSPYLREFGFRNMGSLLGDYQDHSEELEWERSSEGQAFRPVGGQVGGHAGRHAGRQAGRRGGRRRGQRGVLGGGQGGILLYEWQENVISDSDYDEFDQEDEEGAGFGDY